MAERNMLTVEELIRQAQRAREQREALEALINSYGGNSARGSKPSDQLVIDYRNVAATLMVE